jgi:N-acetylated-alpha-linked acidic dipeptidase
MENVVVRETEKILLDELSLDVPKAVLNKFSRLVRESSSEDENLLKRAKIGSCSYN